jgi:hypothetical protein
MDKVSKLKQNKVKLKLSRKDKIFYGSVILLTALATLAFIAMGESNIFIVPAMFCVAFYWRKHRRTAKQR